MSLWLARWTLDLAVRVRVLAGVAALCSWAKNFTVVVPLSTQVYKNAGGNPAMDWHPIQGGVEIVLVA